MDIYTKFGKEFSSTRQTPWKGWIQIHELLGLTNFSSFLDVGCGNARFLKYLMHLKVKVITYDGLDLSDEMIDIALQETKNFHVNARFYQIDLREKLWETHLDGQYDMIVGFGITHHMITENDINNLLTGIKKLMREDSYLILTFWMFLADPRERKKILREIRPNVFEMKFGMQASRVCRYFETTEIISLLKTRGLTVVDSFLSDGKSNKLNHYFIINQRKNK